MKGGRVVEVKAPQKGLFDQALSEYKKYRAILIVAFVVAIAESILRSLSLPLTTIYYITHFLGFASVALAIWIFVEERNYASKFSEAENERRCSMLDNALGSKYARTESNNYYDTDQIDKGIKKVLANLHESCIYTSAEAKYMVKRQCWIAGVGIVVMLICAYIGLKNIAFSSLILEFFLSCIIVGRYLDVKSIATSAEQIEKDACQIWVDIENGTKSNLEAKVFNLLLRYETSLASAQIILSDAAYTACGQDCLDEWNEKVKRYHIG
jgi:hypothetical protein